MYGMSCNTQLCFKVQMACKLLSLMQGSQRWLTAQRRGGNQGQSCLGGKDELLSGPQTHIYPSSPYLLPLFSGPTPYPHSLPPTPVSGPSPYPLSLLTTPYRVALVLEERMNASLELNPSPYPLSLNTHVSTPYPSMRCPTGSTPLFWRRGGPLQWTSTPLPNHSPYPLPFTEQPLSWRR